MREYRITVTIADSGDMDAAERCLDALNERAPETGPVVSVDLAANTLSLTIAVDATDPWAAANLASSIYADSLTKAELPLAPVIDIQVSVVDDEHPTTQRRRELVGA